MDYTVHRILQARILEWVTLPFSRGSSQTRDWTQVSHNAGRFFTVWATREAHWYSRWRCQIWCWLYDSGFQEEGQDWNSEFRRHHDEVEISIHGSKWDYLKQFIKIKAHNWNNTCWSPNTYRPESDSGWSSETSTLMAEKETEKDRSGR